MMDVRTVTRSAIDQTLWLARVPLGAAVRLLPANLGQRETALLAIDRADAAVRAAAGELLRDDALRDDASLRRAALDERTRARELRRQADEANRVADERLGAELDAAQRARQDAAAEAERRSRQVAQERTESRLEAKRVSSAEAQIVDEARERASASTEKLAKQDRLRVLDDVASALDKEADALAALDEADRLRRAASDTKSARKGSA